MGKNGRKLVEDRYTWKHVSENMIKIIIIDSYKNFKTKKGLK